MKDTDQLKTHSDVANVLVVSLLADRHFAPNIVRTAMAAGRVSDERDQFTSQDKLMQMHIKESRQAPEPGKFERYSSNIIQQIIDDECRRRQLPVKFTPLLVTV